MIWRARAIKKAARAASWIEGAVNAAELTERFENALYYVARGWRRVVDRRFKYRGMSMARWRTIAAAAQFRSPLSQSEVAHMLSVSDASMLRMIDRLAEGGLVIREPSISDRRVNRIVITEAGNRLYAELKNEAAAVRQQLLAGIEPTELAHLTELLEQLQGVFLRRHDDVPFD